MSMRIILALFLAAFLVLAGCDNDSGSLVQEGTGDDGDGGGDDGGDGGGDPEVNLVLGSGADPDFEPGTLEVEVSPLASGGSTGINGRLLDENGDPAEGSYEAILTSPCVDDNLATINSPVTISNGEFSTTYTANGCSGTDTVTASVVIDTDDGESTLTATGTVELEPATLGSLVFVGAEPSLIGLKGMGASGIPETAQVTFEVQDIQGNPSAGRTVEFTLSTNVGDIQLSTTEATSNSQGQVTTQLIAGTVPGPVRVNAMVQDTAISSQSTQVAIGTGIAAQQGVSIALEAINPAVQGCVGEKYEVTVHARDRFSNPVVDGTVVQFTTEGGRIQSSCTMGDGECAVEWTSQAPWPPRSTILAYLEGEESFKDRTGDGLFGEQEANEGPTVGDYDPMNPDNDELVGWLDVGEPYRDDNESGGFEPGIDGFFWDYDGSGDQTGPNSLFDGALCGAGITDDAARDSFQQTYCGSPQAPIGKAIVMVLADNGGANITVPASYTVGTGPLVVEVSDPNGQPLPTGSTVSLDIGYGEILGSDSINIGSTNIDGPLTLGFSITESGEDDTSICDVGVVTVQTAGNSCSDGVEIAQEFEICGSTN